MAVFVLNTLRRQYENSSRTLCAGWAWGTVLEYNCPVASVVRNSLAAAPREGAHLDGGVEIDFDDLEFDFVDAQTPQLGALRKNLMWALPLAITIAWFLFVWMGGHTDRVTNNYRASLTMVFGGFVAGSTPQGGGAVAFPVFTKLLEVPTPVARSFSLFVQASGMVMASISIILSGRKVDWKALRIAIPAGVIGLVIGLFALGDQSTPFWVTTVSDAYVKVSFTLIVFAVALIVRLISMKATMYDEVPSWNYRSIGAMFLFALGGGVFSSLTGSGSDVLLFVFVVLVAKVDARVAIPTSIISMASVSLIGFLIVGFWHGQIDIGVVGEQVVSVGGDAFGPELASQFDLFGLWLAGAPVVLWMAPIGSYWASRVKSRTVIGFVGVIALSEVVSTAIFLDEFRTDNVLIAFALIGMVVVWLAVRQVDRLSEWIMRADPPSVPTDQSSTPIG